MAGTVFCSREQKGQRKEIRKKKHFCQLTLACWNLSIQMVVPTDSERAADKLISGVTGELDTVPRAVAVTSGDLAVRYADCIVTADPWNTQWVISHLLESRILNVI